VRAFSPAAFLLFEMGKGRGLFLFPRKDDQNRGIKGMEEKKREENFLSLADRGRVKQRGAEKRQIAG